MSTPKTGKPRGNPKWVKGGPSPNPRGMTKKQSSSRAGVREWARQVCDAEGREALLKLATECRDPKLRFAAWKYLFDRAYGAPGEEVKVTLEDQPTKLYLNLIPVQAKE